MKNIMDMDEMRVLGVNLFETMEDHEQASQEDLAMVSDYSAGLRYEPDADDVQAVIALERSIVKPKTREQAFPARNTRYIMAPIVVELVPDRRFGLAGKLAAKDAMAIAQLKAMGITINPTGTAARGWMPSLALELAQRKAAGAPRVFATRGFHAKKVGA